MEWIDLLIVAAFAGISFVLKKLGLASSSSIGDDDSGYYIEIDLSGDDE